ncbi:MAG: RNA-protein complex protein Nop10 [Haloquadratum sp.]|nr:RNA-protein complex protein Nop10 [Haloferacaceae archaeon]MDR9444567.1 RNA-protein complex protein Nop10 [Haloquadratum sp.]
MRSAIRRCRRWSDEHDRPVYTLGERCPECDGPAEMAMPPPFDPTDRYGAYRRARFGGA